MPNTSVVANKKNAAKKTAAKPAIKILAQKTVVAKPGMKRAVTAVAVAKPVSSRKRETVRLPQRMLSEAERQQMVATAAYYISERRGFNSGDELADWFTAEEEIASMLRKG